jgi:ectoine hydroxylase
MTPDEILSIPAKVLSQKQRQRYFGDGFILLEKFLSDDWIARLHAATERMLEESRKD